MLLSSSKQVTAKDLRSLEYNQQSTHARKVRCIKLLELAALPQNTMLLPQKLTCQSWLVQLGWLLWKMTQQSTEVSSPICCCRNCWACKVEENSIPSGVRPRGKVHDSCPKRVSVEQLLLLALQNCNPILEVGIYPTEGKSLLGLYNILDRYSIYVLQRTYKK